MNWNFSVSFYCMVVLKILFDTTNGIKKGKSWYYEIVIKVSTVSSRRSWNSEVACCVMFALATPSRRWYDKCNPSLKTFPSFCCRKTSIARQCFPVSLSSCPLSTLEWLWKFIAFLFDVIAVNWLKEHQECGLVTEMLSLDWIVSFRNLVWCDVSTVWALGWVQTFLLKKYLSYFFKDVLNGWPNV